MLQHRHFKALLQLVLFNPSQVTKNFQELVMFLTQSANPITLASSPLQVCICYPEEMNQFRSELQSLLQQHSSVLHPEQHIDQPILTPLFSSLLELFFQLLQCQDKLLRMVLQLLTPHINLTCSILRRCTITLSLILNVSTPSERTIRSTW